LDQQQQLSLTECTFFYAAKISYWSKPTDSFSSTTSAVVGLLVIGYPGFTPHKHPLFAVLNWLTAKKLLAMEQLLPTLQPNIQYPGYIP